MPEYTFFLTKGYRTQHVKAKNLYQAYLLAAKDHDQEAINSFGEIVPNHYQVASDGDYTMSGWKWSNDKRLLKIRATQYEKSATTLAEAMTSHLDSNYGRSFEN